MIFAYILHPYLFRFLHLYNIRIMCVCVYVYTGTYMIFVAELVYHFLLYMYVQM